MSRRALLHIFCSLLQLCFYWDMMSNCKFSRNPCVPFTLELWPVLSTASQGIKRGHHSPNPHLHEHDQYYTNAYMTILLVYLEPIGNANITVPWHDSLCPCWGRPCLKYPQRVRLYVMLCVYMSKLCWRGSTVLSYGYSAGLTVNIDALYQADVICTDPFVSYRFDNIHIKSLALSRIESYWKQNKWITSNLAGCVHLSPLFRDVVAS